MTIETMIDPELAPLLEMFTAIDAVPVQAEALRMVMQQMAEAAPPIPDLGVETTTHTIDGPAGSIDLLVDRSKTAEASAPGILFIHGGGYIAGSPELNRLQTQAIAAQLGCSVVSARYRLAPETQAPGPLEDCYAALAWMAGNAGALSIDPARIGVWGVSAGGGLAAALCLLARDRGEIKIGAQLLNYPMLDDRTVLRDLPEHFGALLWTRDWNAYGWESYLGVKPGSDGVSPYAAPARAEDLSGLPPTFIGTAALDLFLDENLTYARRLMEAGVPTELHVSQGAFHAFEMAADTAVTQRAVGARFGWMQATL